MLPCPDYRAGRRFRRLARPAYSGLIKPFGLARTEKISRHLAIAGRL